MSKKTRKEKEIARLRREVEILRAGLKSDFKPKTPEPLTALQSLMDRPPTLTETPQLSPDANPPPDQSYLKKDLLRTFLLSLVAFSLIFAVYLLQTKFSQLLPDFLKA